MEAERNGTYAPLVVETFSNKWILHNLSPFRWIVSELEFYSDSACTQLLSQQDLVSDVIFNCCENCEENTTAEVQQSLFDANCQQEEPNCLHTAQGTDSWTTCEDLSISGYRSYIGYVFHEVHQVKCVKICQAECYTSWVKEACLLAWNNQTLLWEQVGNALEFDSAGNVVENREPGNISRCFLHPELNAPDDLLRDTRLHEGSPTEWVVVGGLAILGLVVLGVAARLLYLYVTRARQKSRRMLSSGSFVVEGLLKSLGIQMEALTSPTSLAVMMRSHSLNWTHEKKLHLCQSEFQIQRKLSDSFLLEASVPNPYRAIVIPIIRTVGSTENPGLSNLPITLTNQLALHGLATLGQSPKRCQDEVSMPCGYAKTSMKSSIRAYMSYTAEATLLLAPDSNSSSSNLSIETTHVDFSAFEYDVNLKQGTGYTTSNADASNASSRLSRKQVASMHSHYKDSPISTLGDGNSGYTSSLKSTTDSSPTVMLQSVEFPPTSSFHIHKSTSLPTLTNTVDTVDNAMASHTRTRVEFPPIAVVDDDQMQFIESLLVTRAS